MSNWKPGKGAHLVFNEDMLNFYVSAIADIAHAYEVTKGDEGQDEDPKQVLRALLLKDEYQSELEGNLINEWTLEKDKFGSKVFASKEVNDKQCRITLVLTSRGELKLDVREWYDSDNV